METEDQCEAWPTAAESRIRSGRMPGPGLRTLAPLHQGEFLAPRNSREMPEFVILN